MKELGLTSETTFTKEDLQLIIQDNLLTIFFLCANRISARGGAGARPGASSFQVVALGLKARQGLENRRLDVNIKVHGQVISGGGHGKDSRHHERTCRSHRPE